MPNVVISNQRKAACVQKYIQTGSIASTRRWYATTYGAAAPSRNSILRWYRRFLQNGTVADLPRSGRPQADPQVVSRIEGAFHENPRLSLRVAERVLQVLRSTICDVLKKKLKMFPYKISFLQQLSTRVYGERLQWSQHCRTEMEVDPQYLSRIVFSDECLFHTNGVVNKHNVRIWGTSNPKVVEEVPQNSEKVMVWCAMHKTKIIGPYFFRAPTVDTQAYKSMLRYYGLNHIAQLPGSPIFQQDGAPAHTSNATREYLTRKLGNQWISKRGPTNWPARSPDLTPLDFFLWGYVKDKVYAVRIHSLQHLRTRITRAIRSIDTATLSRVWKNVETRMDCVVRQQGKHIEQMTF